MKYAWQKVKAGDEVFYHKTTERGERILLHHKVVKKGDLGLIILETGSVIFGSDIVHITRDKKEVL